MNNIDLMNYWIESSDRDYESIKRTMKQNIYMGIIYWTFNN